MKGHKVCQQKSELWILGKLSLRSRAWSDPTTAHGLLFQQKQVYPEGISS